MQSGTYEYQSKVVRKYVNQGRLEGRKKGLEKGRQEGRYEEARSALLDVLDTRGLAVSATVRARIDACADLMHLKEWRRRAIVAESAEAVFAP